jgi:hypothetical protein
MVISVTSINTLRASPPDQAPVSMNPVVSAGTFHQPYQTQSVENQLARIYWSKRAKKPTRAAQAIHDVSVHSPSVLRPFLAFEGAAALTRAGFVGGPLTSDFTAIRAPASGTTSNDLQTYRSMRVGIMRAAPEL